VRHLTSLRSNRHGRNVYARAALTAVTLTLYLPTSPGNTRAANVNAVFAHHASDHSTSLENAHVGYIATLHELPGRAIETFAENLHQRIGPHSSGNHAGTLGFGIDPPAFPPRRETLTAAAVSAIPAATANVRFEPLSG
jgi:hypothetical protein